jgi:putative transposase
MMNPPNRHERKPNRARGYDYATPGAYFITACTCNRVPLFGDIVDGVYVRNDFTNNIKDRHSVV